MGATGGGAAMLKDVLIAPSILSADFLRLGEEVEDVACADLVHYDVMDGHFVPNLSYGPDVLRALKAATELPLDVHLMVDNPEEVVGSYLAAGADLVSFHMEAQRHALRIVDAIRGAGARAAVALNPGTPASALEAIIGEIDMVLVMSVNPGLGGQRLVEGTYGKLRALRGLCAELGVSPLVEVDGGVSAANAARLCAAGADVLVAGSAVFGAGDRAAAVRALRAAGREGLVRRG